ncbi:hypothetical protein ABT354_11240 [Streptomyces sp. NPDC000594]|uniref:hypothetical protein n=1 Tax=Streptomyces sp. NPDC000594 TaxID=3154261 RepID=UPI00332616CF
MTPAMSFDFIGEGWAGTPGTEIVLEIAHLTAHPDTPAAERVRQIATGQDWPATGFTLTQEAYGASFREGDLFEVRAKLSVLDGGESQWSAAYRTPPVPYIPPAVPEIGSITWSTG